MPRRMPLSRFTLAASLSPSKRWPASFYAAIVLPLTTTAALLSAQAPTAPSDHFVVVLDAAHGGDDPGARLGDEAEKNFTLALSVRLRSLLAARGVAVVTTRESDATINMNRRAEIANHASAQACLILHASQAGSGAHLFVSSLAPAQHSLFHPWRTAQAEWIARSLSLAGVLNSALTQAAFTVTLGRSALPAIDSMTCPAVAVEIAPARSSAESGSAGSDDTDYQLRIAQALAAALVEWRSDDRGNRLP